MSILYDRFTEDDIRDWLAMLDMPHTDWQVKILTDLLNSRGRIAVTVCRHNYGAVCREIRRELDRSAAYSRGVVWTEP